ncbi:MAG: CheY-like chemotaxis protein [Candidatus Paceibacteria bacterium]|jgi:CheY-like chemotaxis protein
MRLDHLTPAHVRRAVQIYMDLAWSNGERANPWFDPARLEGISSVEQLFELFTSCGAQEDGPKFQRYTLRLGNESYPFMKFVLQEYLVDHEYFFSVDTHDDLQIPESSPDYPAWIELRESNRRLKDTVEGAWRRAGLPTNESLQELAEGLARVERSAKRDGLILVVDDEKGVARGLEALLTARGYAVEVAFDGLQVLERLEHDPLPDLVLMDYSMPGLDGEEVVRRMRDCARLENVPVLMVTASSIDLGKIQRVSGLLRKPYPRQLLFAVVEQLLGSKTQ